MRRAIFYFPRLFSRRVGIRICASVCAFVCRAPDHSLTESIRASAVMRHPNAARTLSPAAFCVMCAWSFACL
jgi:hypothetical protein